MNSLQLSNVVGPFLAATGLAFIFIFIGAYVFARCRERKYVVEKRTENLFPRFLYTYTHLALGDYKPPLNRRRDLKFPERISLRSPRPYKSRDFDYFNNCQRLLRGKTCEVFGETQFEGKIYSFPVKCSKNDFLVFLRHLWTFPPDVRARLIVLGEVHESIVPLFRSVYPVLDHATQRGADLVDRFVPLGSYSEESLEQLAFFSRIASVVYHVWNRDIPALVLLAASHPEFFRYLYDLYGSDDLESFVSSFSVSDDTVELGDIGMQDVYSVLPQSLKISPILSRSVALVSFLTMAGIGGSREHLPRFLTYFKFSTLTETVVGAALLYQLVKVVWEGAVAFRESGDWHDFLGTPRDVTFVRRARDLLSKFASPSSLEEERSKIAEAKNLLTTRQYCVDVGEILQLKNRLIEAIDKKELYLQYYAERNPPFVFFLSSAPGLGKTTLIHSLIDFCAVRDRVPREVGDVVHYNIHDPFPVETCKNDNARYIVLNDIPSDYSQYQKLGMVPLEVLLQTLIDSAPFSPPGASIEAKERILNNIKYVFISANKESFKCPTDPLKVHRRVCGGALYFMEFAGNKTFADTKKMSQADRNQATLFRPLVVDIAEIGNVLSFIQDTSRPNCTYAGFIKDVDAKITAHEESCNEEKQRLGTASEKCACGLPVSFHVFPSGTKAFFPNCSVGEYDYGHILGGGAVPVGAYDLIWWAGFITIAKYFYVHLERYISNQLIYTNIYIYTLWLKMLVLMIEIRLRSFWISRYFISDEVEAQAWNRHQSWLKFRNLVSAFVAKYWKIMLIALSSGLLLTLCRTIAVPCGPVFSRSEVNRDSMRTIQPTSFQKYTPTQMRSWAAKDGPEGVAIISTGVAFSDLARLVRDAMIVLDARVSDGSCGSVRAICMSPTQLLVNRHYLYKAHAPLDVTFSYKGVSLRVKGDEAIEIPDCEFLVIPNPFRPACANLWRKCLSKPHTGVLDATVINAEVSSPVVAQSSTFTLHDRTYPSYEWSAPIVVGDCGTIVLGTTGSDHFIVGAVSYGKSSSFSSKVGCSLFIHGEASKVSPLGGPFVEEVQVVGLPQDLTVLKSSSEFLANPVPTLHPFGSSLEPTRKFTTSFRPTRLLGGATHFLSKKYDVPRKVGAMVETDEGAKWKSAWSNTFAKSGGVDLSTQTMKTGAMRAYLKDVLKFKESQPEVELHPLDMFEAFLGHDSIGVDGVPKSTSAGTQWREHGYSNKTDCFERKEDNFVYLKEEFRVKVDELLELARDGIVATPLCEASPKDEVREAVKLEQYKIRLFSVLGAHYNIAVRMYVMPLINILLHNPHLSECYGQMNAGSKQWTDLRNRLSRFENWSDSDFSSYDSCHGHGFLSLFALFIYEFAQEVGYTLEEAKIAYVLVYSVVTQLFKYQSDYFLKTKGMPSGVIFTLALNSVVNSILARMAFAELTGLSPELYQFHVVTATVGDDNLSTISNEVFPKFNILLFQKLYFEWGYTVTPASKAGVVTASIRPEDAVFVKRRFELWEDGFYRAPIDRDVLYRPLCYEESNAKISSAQRLRGVYGSCVREAYLHGRAFFDEYVLWINALYDEHSLVYDPLAFEALDQEFHEARFSTYQLGEYEMPYGPKTMIEMVMTLPPDQVDSEMLRWMDAGDYSQRIRFLKVCMKDHPWINPKTRIRKELLKMQPDKYWKQSRANAEVLVWQAEPRAPSVVNMVYGMANVANWLISQPNGRFFLFVLASSIWALLYSVSGVNDYVDILIGYFGNVVLLGLTMLFNTAAISSVGSFDIYAMAGVLLEEQHKYLFPLSLPLYEYSQRLKGGGSIILSTLPFLMHVYTYALDPIDRWLFHLSWNYIVPRVVEHFVRFLEILLIPEAKGGVGSLSPSNCVMQISTGTSKSLGIPCTVGLTICALGQGGPDAANNSPASLNQNADSSSLTEQTFTSRVVGDEVLPVHDTLVTRVGRPAQKDGFTDFISQPVKVFHHAWTGASVKTLLTHNLFETWKTLAPVSIKNKFANLLYCRGTIRLTVVVQGASQMCGQYVLSAYPNPSYNFSWDTDTTYLDGASVPNSRIVPHVVIDPSKSGTYTLDLEMMSPTGWYELARHQGGSYRVIGLPLVPLGTGTENAVDISICVYASFVDADFQGKTVPLGGFQEDENSWSSVAAGIGKMSRTIGEKLPAISPFTTVVSSIATPVASVLKFLGFSKPSVLYENVRISSTVDPWSQVDGPSSALVMGKSQGQSLGLGPQFMNGSLEDMSADHLCSIPFLSSQHSVSLAVAVESFVFKKEIGPWNAVHLLGGNRAVPSAMSQFATCCTSWVGDMTIRLEFVASVFHRATFLVAFDPLPRPSGSEPNFADALSTLENTTIEITGNTCVDVVIPFMQPRPVLQSNESNGAIYVYLINPVVTNGSTTPIWINAFYSSDNIRFFAPNSAGVSLVPRYETYTRPLNRFSDWMPSTRIEFGKSTDLTNIGGEVYGDVVRSVKDITTRLCLAMSPYARDADDGNYIGYPPGIMTATGPMHMNWSNMWDAAYIGVRGSTRHSFIPFLDGTNWVNWSITCSRKILGWTLYGNNTWTDAGTVGLLGATYALTRSNPVQGSLDMVFPMTIPYSYRIPTAKVSDTLGKFFLTLGLPLQVDSMLPFMHLEGAGDDYVYGGYIGFPITVYS